MRELLEVLEAISDKDWHGVREEIDINGNVALRWHLDDLVMSWIAANEYGVGVVMNAFRICLVGAARGPHIWNITDILGKEETLCRVRVALERIA